MCYLKHVEVIIGLGLSGYNGLVGLWINVFQDRIMLISPGMTYCTHSLREKSGKGCVKLQSALSVIVLLWERKCDEFAPVHAHQLKRSIVVFVQAPNVLNPLTPELNPSAQRCLARFFTGNFASWTVHFVHICMKTNKCNNYSFSLLIMVAPTCFRITLPSSWSVPCAF
jgi:hypothetical protein